MASLSRAFSTVVSADFMLSAGMVIVGSVAAQMLTSWMRTNVMDLGMPGADAVYAVVGAIAVMASPVPRQFARPLALGMVSAGGTTAAREIGVL